MSTEAPDLSIDDAIDRWLNRIRLDRSDQTVASYKRRLRHFQRWCSQNDVHRVSDLSPWLVDQYDTHRRGQGLKAISLKNELSTLGLFLEYCERVGLADDLADSVEMPTVPEGEETDDEFLAPDRAEALLGAYRAGDDRYTREHAVLELAWWTGARKGGIRSLDLEDFNRDEGYVDFRHRAESGTRLKNGHDSERIVGLGSETVDTLVGYVETERPETTDEHGREPLFATVQGRAHINTLTKSVYFGTVPCRHESCPHGHERPSCQHYSRSASVGCPSSLSPHPIRSGSIMWQLNRGLRPDRVADRVDATMETIEMYYDKITRLEEYRKRRAEDLDKLGFDEQKDT